MLAALGFALVVLPAVLLCSGSAFLTLSSAEESPPADCGTRTAVSVSGATVELSELTESPPTDAGCAEGPTVSLLASTSLSSNAVESGSGGAAVS